LFVVYATVVQAAWKVTYLVTVPWSKRQNLAIAVAGRVTSCVLSFISFCDLVAMLSYSRVIVPNLKAALAALQGLVAVVVVPERNAIAAARSVTLRVRAPKHLEVVAQEATAVVVVVAVAVEEATVISGAVKKHGARCPVLSCLRAREGY
jgi:hypothetical protein